MRTGRPSRLKGFNYIGFHCYFLTFCTDWRRQWFTNASAVGLVREQFVRVANKERFAILAYCFMPDHVHLLVEGLAEDSDCRSFIVKSKQCSAHAYAKEFQSRLWQPAGYEHVLRDDERVHVVARYILENPVRAGLAPTVLDYPFLGSEVYDVKELLDGLL